MAMVAIAGEDGENSRGRDIPDFREIPLAPRTQRAVTIARDASLWLARHWLALANGLFLATLIGAAATPLMMSMGLQLVAEPLFASYRLICHQLPSRTFFLLGHPMAMCQRDVAIYGTIGAAGITFALTGRRWQPLPWQWYFALLLPIAVDGTTQLFGLRESSWELRLLTGTMFAMATVWLAYPHLERFAAEVLEEAATLSSSTSPFRGEVPALPGRRETDFEDMDRET